MFKKIVMLFLVACVLGSSHVEARKCCCPGPRGSTGPQGPAGVLAYSYIYNTAVVDDLAAGAAVPFSNNGPSTPDISHALGSTDIIINTPGTYAILFLVTATVENQFSIYVNGVRQPSSTYGIFSNEAQTNGMVILSSLAAQSIITLVNDSGTDVGFNATDPLTAVNASIILAQVG